MKADMRCCILLVVLLALSLAHGSLALPQPRVAETVEKRNLGGPLKDWYLSKFTKNYFCTDTGRLVPVDPASGQMLLRYLRKRNALDDMLGHSHATEKGRCRNPTWVLPPGWTQPIPVTQFQAQYPWMLVDERGALHLDPDYKAWLEQRAAAQPGGGASTVGGTGAGASSGGGGAANVIQDGGVGYVPKSALNVAPGMAGDSGFGTDQFGNGMAAGTAAHI